MPNVLIICTANICRSPVAAAMLQDRLRKRGLANWTVRSAGTWAIVARGASRYSIDVSRRGGLDISNHRARMVDEDQMNQADLVLTMEVGHAEALRAEFPKQAHKVYMLTEMTGHASAGAFAKRIDASRIDGVHLLRPGDHLLNRLYVRRSEASA